MAVKPLDFISWWAARLWMSKCEPLWGVLWEEGTQALIDALRSGQVECRSAAPRFAGGPRWTAPDFLGAGKDHPTLDEVIAGLCGLRFLGEREVVASYEAAEVVTTTMFSGSPLSVSRARTERWVREARITGAELVKSKLRDYLICYKGLAPTPPLPTLTVTGTKKILRGLACGNGGPLPGYKAVPAVKTVAEAAGKRVTRQTVHDAITALGLKQQRGRRPRSEP